MRTKDFLLLIFLLGSTLTMGSGAVYGFEPDEKHPRLALLIGVGEYPGLSPAEQLDGSGNDVAIMQELLVARFGFEPQHVTTLIDQQASGEGIRRALATLADVVNGLPRGGPIAQVVIHFSGHGSQLPDQASGNDHDETDGLDETWVPYDATKQGGEQDIRDDEINLFAEKICREGKARLLIIADCCHSGTGARGVTKIRQLHRTLKPSTPAARERQLPAGVVFLSACRAREVEPEFKDDDKSYGLLTRFLVETLQQEREISKLTYDLAQKSILARYRARRVLQAPIPQLEGDSETLLKSSILGLGTDVDRAAYYPVQSTSSNSAVRLQAGKLHNVTVGSLFELYEQADQIDSAPSLAWLEITKVDGTRSEAKVIRWEQDNRSQPLDHHLPRSFKNGYAILRQPAPGDASLRLKVVQVDEDNLDGPPLARDAVPAVVLDSLTEARHSDEASWLKWTTQPDQPSDLLLRIAGDHAALFPATGVAEVTRLATTRGSSLTSLRGGWGPFDLRSGLTSTVGDGDTDEKPASLSDYLRRINRARNLVSLAENGAGQKTSDYNVNLELLDIEFDFEHDEITHSKPWRPDSDRVLAMREDDLYAFRVSNLGKDNRPVYVTVLEVTPNMGIQRVIPDDDLSMKLEPGDSRISFVLQCTPPLGTYHAVMLVTREEHDFRFITQRDLGKTRGGHRADTNSLQSQLEVATHFLPPQSRGRRMRPQKSDSSWHAQVLSWQVDPNQ